jgi:superfamily II DNA or RNA helicase
MYKLRDYQQSVYNSIKKAFKTQKKLVIVLPTRSGKTVLFSEIARKFENANKPVLILTHRQEIFEQTFDKLTDFKISAGQIKRGKALSKNLIQLGMIQTVHNLIKRQERIKNEHKFKNVDLIRKPALIVIDEVHHSTSNTWKAVLNYFDDVPRFGFTATPERLDGSGLVELFETLIIGKSTQWMIDNYWLSNPVHLRPQSSLDKENLKKRAGDYDKRSMSEIMKKHVVCGQVVKYYRVFFNGAPVIVFCCTIDHAEKMTEAYKADGWRAVVIHGKMTKAQRNEAMGGFKTGKYQILLSVDLIGEGVDVPACAGVQILRKTASLALYLQMAARGLTPIYADGYNLEDKTQRRIALQKGKPNSIILDHAGNYWNHGKITKTRDWSINHKKRNNREKTKIKKVECPKCHFTWEIGTKICQYCGFNFQIAAQEKKEFEMIELKEKLINVNEIEEQSAENLSKIILRIKEYKNKNKAMFAVLHQSIAHGESGMKKKVKAMCQGLEYDNFYHRRVWDFLVKKYGEKMELLA